MDGVRFGCGVVVGVVLGTWLVADFFNIPLAVILIVAAAILFGVIAVRYGDPFWLWLSRWLDRLRWL